MTTTRTARRFFLLLLAAGAVLLALVIRPLATALFLATVLAVVLGPAHRRLTGWLGNRAFLASAIVVLGVAILLVAPLVGMSTFIVKEASEGLAFVSSTVRSEGVNGLLAKLPRPLEEFATRVISHIPEQKEGELDQRVMERVGVGGGKAVALVGVVAKATGSLVFQTVMMLIALFSLLLQGDSLLAWLDGVLPLAKGQTRELATEFKRVSQAVIVSSTITSAIQALAALLGYFIAHVPHPLFFATATFFVAFIPAIGATSVCLVAALILLASGHPYWALFLGIWGITIVALVDNLVKPLLIKRDMRMNGAIVFFALVGGVAAFGAVGLLLGPLAVALFLALLRIYERDFKTAGTAGGARG